MRIRLTLQPVAREEMFPINYQYPLSSAIYKILANASPAYASFLHKKGYITSKGKPLKLFTFSKIFSSGIQRFRSSLVVQNNRSCTLLISSPMLNDFIQNFVTGLFEKQTLEIGGPHSVGHFTISCVETLGFPSLSDNVKFICLSPIVSSTLEEHRGNLSQYYFRPGDQRLSEVLQNNLRHKYEIIHGKTATTMNIEFIPDMDYVQRWQQAGKRVTKKITIKEGRDAYSTDIIAFEVPFTLKGDTGLMTVAYEAGIGEKNSLGFGMIEVAGVSKN